MSDSLNATVIVSLWVFTISANVEVELLEDEDELPRLPAVVVPVDPLEEEPDEEEFVAVPDVEPADTESPGDRLSSETIVPLVGACSSVSLSAVLALCTLARALYTEASAEAMLEAEDVVVLDEAPAPELPADPDAPVLGALVVGDVAGVVVVGVVVVVVGVVVLVVVEVVVVGVVLVVVVWVGVVWVGVVVSDTNSVVAEFAVSRLVLVDAELVDVEPFSAAVS
jgi:hypothetical protein